ncbi:GET complex subunit get1 [Coelomomyces lativittatus]|nr:GET complex subunit get1 [Coelomomyces lativittatus]
MDEFAKWARLRRQLDSKSADYDRLITEANSTKVWFQIKSQFVTRPLFYLTYSFLIYYFRETPMFYIPKDWFNLAGELMYLPLAPFGSVSVILWMFACRRFVRNFISKDMETMSNKHE